MMKIIREIANNSSLSLSLSEKSLNADFLKFKHALGIGYQGFLFGNRPSGFQ